MFILLVGTLLLVVHGLVLSFVWVKTAGVLLMLLGANLELAAVWIWARRQLNGCQTATNRRYWHAN